ncbi:MAG: hypothetical protein QM775_09540 [Pirellulales bacterium]
MFMAIIIQTQRNSFDETLLAQMPIARQEGAASTQLHVTAPTEKSDERPVDFLALYSAGRIEEARADLIETLDQHRDLGLTDSNWRVRWAKAWKRELDIVTEFDEQQREAFFRHREEIGDIYRMCTRTASPESFSGRLKSLIEEIPESIDGACPTRLDCVEASGYLASLIRDNQLAFKQFAELKRLRLQMVGRDNWMYASDCEQLGLCALALSNIEDADSLLTECFEVRRNLFGVEAYLSLVAYSNLGALDVKRDDYSSGITKLTFALDRFRERRADSGVLGSCEFNLAKAYLATGDAIKGSEQFGLAIAHTRQKLHPAHPVILDMMSTFADKCVAAGFSERATAIRDEIREMKNKYHKKVNQPY